MRDRPRAGPAGRPAVYIGGIGELWQGDLDLGRRAVELLIAEDLGDGVLVEDISYGAVNVAQRLEDLRPARLVLLSAVRRGRRPGSVERRGVDPPRLEVWEAHAGVSDALTGYVTIDLVIEVAATFGVLPEDTVAIEAEPVSTYPTDELTPEAETALSRVLELARKEARRAESHGRHAPAAG